jgi:hypothetical protein
MGAESAFRGIVCFQRFNCLFVSRCFQMVVPEPKSGANWIGERLSRLEAEFAGQKYIALISD